MHDQVMRLYGVMHRMRQQLGRTPAPEEIAEAAEMTVAQVNWTLQISRPTVSLNQPVGDDEDGELGDFVEDETALTPAEMVEHQMMRDALRDALQELTPREAMVVRLHYGLDGASPQTLRDVGVRMGLSGERVRQIKEGALRKMRHPRAGRQLRQYLR
jgi:RNA polymerase primary sigma factor